jgi:endonuclease/exonuclease/phosphatase family metal-dependent hydrolase
MGAVSAHRFAGCLALVGCAGVGADQPWVPIETVEGPLSTEQQPPPHPRVPGSVVRVVTYNVDEENDTGPEALSAAILGDPALATADVFVFQEEESYPEEGSSRSSRLAALLGVGYVYVPARQKGDGTHGLAIMSAYPLANVEKMDLPMTRGNARIAVAADVVIGTQMLHVIDVHLETYLDAQQRVQQLRPAVIDAATPVLVSGDFNMGWLQWPASYVPVVSSSSASDQSAVIDSYMHALGFDEPTSGSGPTSHAFGEDARLDAVYPRGLDVSFGGVEHVGPSDHWPMWVDVTMSFLNVS